MCAVLRVGACQTPEFLGAIDAALACVEEFAGQAEAQGVDLRGDAYPVFECRGVRFGTTSANHWRDLHNQIRAQRVRETNLWLVSADVTGRRDEHRIGYGPTSVINGCGRHPLIRAAPCRGAGRRGGDLRTPPPLRIRSGKARQPSSVPAMAPEAFVPPDFDPPTSLVTDRFRLEPLGPQHNEADHAAWMSSIAHIRATPGYPDGDWPPVGGMSLEENLADLRRHADDFTKGTGFTFTVLDAVDDDVIGCVYLYPSTSENCDVTVQSWVRADRADLDWPLADAVANWVATDWPWERLDRCGR